MDNLERKFHLEMVAIYKRAKAECGYNATRFLQMVNDSGGLQTAKRLLSIGPSDGFTALWERDRLDLTVEALILNAPWSTLFSDEELAGATMRLEEYGYQSAQKLGANSE